MRTHLALLAFPALAHAQAVQFPPRSAYQHSAQIALTTPPPEFGGTSTLVMSNWLSQPDATNRAVRYEIWAKAEWNGEQPPQDQGDLRLALVVHVISRIPRADAERGQAPISLAGKEMELGVDQRQPIYLSAGSANTGWADPGTSSSTVEYDEEIPYSIQPNELLDLARTSRLAVRVGNVNLTSSDRRTFQALLDFASRLKPGR